MLKKNVSGQKILVYAIDVVNDTPKTGDAANITAYISKDCGAAAATDDTNPTELDATNMKGFYYFNMLQAETNCELLALSPVSATANIRLDPVIMLPQPDVPATFGAVNDAGASTTDFDTDLTEATNDHYNGAFIHFLTGACAGQARKISDYVGASKNITVAALTDAPTTGDKFLILGRSE